MIAYVDASVVLRVVLGQPGRLAEWKTITTGVASALVELECLRTLDRLRLEEQLTEAQLIAARGSVYQVTDAFEVVEPSSMVLRRAAQPLPIPLGTLDAIHLASAMLWTDQSDRRLVMTTHDRALAIAARASGLRVLGA
ncbi:MAG: PIN domain-containing protein [Gemmatimonadales bacterium]